MCGTYISSVALQAIHTRDIYIYITSTTQDIGFTGDDPKSKCRCSRLPKTHNLIHTSSRTLHYNDKRLCELGFDTVDFKRGQSLGLLLTRDRECHWFLDDEWRGSVQMRDFPLDQPMWGVVDVYGQCKQVRADICTGKPPPPPHSVSIGVTALPPYSVQVPS